MFGRPILVLKDPAMVKQIFVKDFHHFVDRNSKAALDAIMNYELMTDQLWNRSILFARGSNIIQGDTTEFYYGSF